MVVHLLVLGGVVPHQRAAREHQVGACAIEPFVNKEVFLFPSQVAGHLFHALVKIVAHLGGSHVDSMLGTQQGSLVVEGFACI